MELIRAKYRNQYRGLMELNIPYIVIKNWQFVIISSLLNNRKVQQNWCVINDYNSKNNTEDN